MTEEQKLVRKAQQGDTDAFEKLVVLHQSKIYSLALRMAGNPEDAEDLAQEAFLRIWKGIGSFNMDASFSTWAYKLTSNVCIDFLRREKKLKTVSFTYEDEEGGEQELSLPDERYNPESKFEQKNLLESVQEAMDRLEPQYRQVLALRELAGLSYDEIANELKINEGTVKSRLARARERMRRLLIDSGNFSQRNSSECVKGGMRRG